MRFNYLPEFKDLLSAHVVHNTYYPINEFFSFCDKEIATENFEFLMLARTLHPTLGPAAYDFFPSNILEFESRARYIYLHSIQEGAEKMINIDAVKRSTLRRSYEFDFWESDAFDAAHQEIVTLTDGDTYRRFQAGSETHNWLNAAAQKAARNARNNNVQPPAAPIPHLPPAPAPPVPQQIQLSRHRRNQAVFIGNQQQQLPTGLVASPLLVSASAPAPSSPSASSVEGANRFPMVVVTAPTAVADRAREIHSVLPAVATNTPAVIITPAKPKALPRPSVPASILAKKKPVPPVPVFPNRQK